MQRLRISRAARSDLTEILATSLSRWGEEGRARYARLLTQGMVELAASPEGPLTRARSELAAGMRSFHLKHVRKNPWVKAPVHLLVYRTSRTDTIELVRVLHERMEPSEAMVSQLKPRRGRRSP